MPQFDQMEAALRAEFDKLISENAQTLDELIGFNTIVHPAGDVADDGTFVAPPHSTAGVADLDALGSYLTTDIQALDLKVSNATMRKTGGEATIASLQAQLSSPESQFAYATGQGWRLKAVEDALAAARKDYDQVCGELGVDKTVGLTVPGVVMPIGPGLISDLDAKTNARDALTDTVTAQRKVVEQDKLQLQTEAVELQKQLAAALQSLAEQKQHALG